MADDTFLEIRDTAPKVADELGKGALGGIGTAIGGPLIGVAGNILGGLMSNLFNRKQVDEGEGFQREFAQNAISWRVADAKRAGIHPLAALGAQVSGGQPMAIGDSLGENLARSGQDISSAITKLMTRNELAAQQLNLNAVQAQIDESDARRLLINAQRAKLMAPDKPSGVGVMSDEQYKSGLQSQDATAPGYTNTIEVKPGEVTQMMKNRPGVIAGNDQGNQEIILPAGGAGLPFNLPRMMGESWQEHISEMSVQRFYGLMMENANKYGKQWLRDFMDYYLKGQTIKHQYTPMSDPRYKAPAHDNQLDQMIHDKVIDLLDKGRRKLKDMLKELP